MVISDVDSVPNHQNSSQTDIDSRRFNKHTSADSKINKTCLSTISLPSTSLKNNTSQLTSSTPETAAPPGIEEVSIYNVRTNLQRNFILVALAIMGFTFPFCDTIYLPALSEITLSLNTTDTLVAISVSIYLFMSGVLSLLWGSLSDRFGRKITLIIALVLFVIASIVCIFAPNIAVLIVFRAIEGGTVSSTLVIGQALIADIYPDEKRGSAAGFFFLPFNIGPIIGPLIGGPLSGAFGWRSTFWFLTIFSFLVVMMGIIAVPETHQYIVKERFHKANPTKCITDAMPNEKPLFEKPWHSLTYLRDLTVLPYIAISTTTFATLYTSFALFSNYLEEAPYNYSPTIIGVLFVPSGIALLTASLLGGWLSDKGSHYFANKTCAEGRLVPGLILCTLTPIGLLIYGWTFHYKVHLAGPIIGQILLSFGQSILEPAISTYLTIKKQETAAAISAANTCLNFCGAGLIVTIAVPLEHLIGTGPYFSIMSGINIVTISLGSFLVYKAINRSRCCATTENHVINVVDSQCRSQTLLKEKTIKRSENSPDCYWF